MKYPNLFDEFNTHIDLPINAYLDLEGRLIHKKIGKNNFYLKKVKWLITYHLLMINNIINEDEDEHVKQLNQLKINEKNTNSISYPITIENITDQTQAR